MNITLLYEAGMRACGRVLKVLPQDEIGSPLMYMQKILREETTPALNILLPRLLTKTFPIYALTKVAEGDDDFASIQASMDSRYNAFRVPSHLVNGAPIQGVKDCFPAYTTTSQDGGLDHSGYFGSSYPNKYGRYSSANLYSRVLMTNLRYADALVAGTINPQFRFKFFQPNILWINKPYADDSSQFITATFRVNNDDDLVTVPDTAFEGIKKLFILDLKRSLFNEYGMFSELETPYGTVNLRMDDWSGAESERDEYYKDLLGTSHFRNTSMKSG